MKLETYVYIYALAGSTLLGNIDAKAQSNYTATFQASIKAVSLGSNIAFLRQGSASLYTNGVQILNKVGFDRSGGGFIVAVVEPETGKLIESPYNFLTVDDSRTNSPTFMQAHRDLANYLVNVPNGKIIMLAIAGNSGLNEYTGDSSSMINCRFRQELEVGNLIGVLHGFGSTNIDNYCSGDSWSMITKKGDTKPIIEKLAKRDSAISIHYLPYKIELKQPVLSIPYFNALYPDEPIIKIDSQPNIETVVQFSGDFKEWNNWFKFTSQSGVYTDDIYGFNQSFFRAYYNYP